MIKLTQKLIIPNNTYKIIISKDFIITNNHINGIIIYDKSMNEIKRILFGHDYGIWQLFASAHSNYVVACCDKISEAYSPPSKLFIINIDDNTMIDTILPSNVTLGKFYIDNGSTFTVSSSYQNCFKFYTMFFSTGTIENVVNSNYQVPYNNENQSILYYDNNYFLEENNKKIMLYDFPNDTIAVEFSNEYLLLLTEMQIIKYNKKTCIQSVYAFDYYIKGQSFCIINDNQLLVLIEDYSPNIKTNSALLVFEF